MTIKQNLTLAGKPITFTSSVREQTALQFLGDSKIDGQGDIVFDSMLHSGNVESVGGTLTIGSEVTIRTGTMDGYVGQSSSPLINEGVISSQTAGRSIWIRGSTLTNRGVVEARDGGRVSVDGGPGIRNDGTMKASSGGSLTLTLYGPWTNTGTLRVDEGTLSLAGTFAAADVGSLTRSGGTINIVGTMTNTGATLSLDEFGGWHLGDGTIRGGKVVAGEAENVLGVTGDGKLDGVTLHSDAKIEEGATLTLAGSWESKGKIDVGGTLAVSVMDATRDAMLTQITALVAAGYNGGKRDGVGIMSSAARDDESEFTGLAIVSKGSAFVIEYT